MKLVYQQDDGSLNCLKLTKKTSLRSFFCLFQGVQESIILLIFEDAATLQFDYLEVGLV